MARSYLQVSTGIWRKPSHRALSAEEQHMLFLIESQPDITAAGTLPLTLRRWAAMFRGGTIEGVRRVLANLEDAGRVVVDDDTEELLVVSFIEDDRGYRNSKRRPVIRRAASEAVSPAIRKALAREFERFNIAPAEDASKPPEPDGPPPPDRSDDDKIDSGEVDQPDEPDQPHEQTDTSAKPQVDNLSDAPSDRAYQNRGDVGCKALVVSPSTHNPHPSSRTPAPSGPVAFVAATLEIDEDEATEVVDQIRRTHRPRTLGGYLRTMAANGDLGPVLADVRQELTRRAAHAERQAIRATMPDPATEPPEGAATPEQAAAARAFLRQLAAGGSGARGGDPARFGDFLGKAATA